MINNSLTRSLIKRVGVIRIDFDIFKSFDCQLHYQFRQEFSNHIFNPLNFQFDSQLQKHIYICLNKQIKNQPK